ncbi:hypothetical protein [Cytobacillus horneckiae]|uniref:hypothetical protein n=1 Tax=Cytobacillus horneckiae TaxID=549687 RepID=UPI00203C45ED|nr:hypothetical protein [Cytobacillus horneckiae]MCM3178160.1 hypothetical protein [Cytobacillus horneckiae]
MRHYESWGDDHSYEPQKPIKPKKAGLNQENKVNTIESQSADASVGGDVYNILILDSAIVCGDIINVQVGNAPINVAANIPIGSDISQDNQKIDK